ncbi:MAG: RHS repeat-associated core domain-containing protein [Eubacterium sp.]|nr:RHS repeat-associated core domain-containing protein [Eubacterium sp.]
MPDQVYSVQWNGSEKLGFAYDNLGRLAQKSFGGNSFGIKYAYENYEIAKENSAAEKRTTTLVKSVETPAGTYSYEYDKLGNIVSVANGSYVTSYEYDGLNQLTRVNDEKAGKTITYSYTNGNITEQKEYEYTTGELGEPTDTKTWSYTDSVWSDLLTDFNGTPIAYDEIGNPLSIGSKQLTWLGRQLQSIADGENTIEYAYNGDGNRISKTVNGVKTEFVYNGDILAGQITGDDKIVFMYDNNSDIFGFILNGTEYYYIKNAQNDVVAIADKDGNVLANYAYDSWGKVTEITGNTALAEQNPIRYRSYYFDFETEWYFLNTRYYSPDMCRFINADGVVGANSDVLAYNNFAYCSNDPVNNTDSNGQWKIKNFVKQVKSWAKKTWNDFKSSTSAKLGALAKGIKSTVRATINGAKKLFEKTPRPKNIGEGSYKNYTSGKTAGFAKASTALGSEATNIAIDVGTSIVGDIMDKEPASVVFNNAMTELLFGALGVGFGYCMMSAALTTLLFFSVSNPFTIAMAVGSAAVTIFGFVVDYVPVDNGMTIKDKAKLTFNEG